MTQNETFVTALGLEVLVTRLSARVRHDPWVVSGILFLAAEASVLTRNLLLAVVLAAFRAAPFNDTGRLIGIWNWTDKE